MNIAAVLVAASLFVATAALAQSAAPTANVPPPPGINDPGVHAVAPAEPALPHRARPLPALHDRADGRGKHMTLPQVSVHREGDKQVQEYRRSGLLYMVVVTPKNGIAQTYDVDPDGTHHLQPGQAPVRPVMYKVLEWGKSKPASAASSETSPDQGH